MVQLLIASRLWCCCRMRATVGGQESSVNSLVARKRENLNILLYARYELECVVRWNLNNVCHALVIGGRDVQLRLAEGAPGPHRRG